MTRIMLLFLLVLVGEGVIFSSGETTASAVKDSRLLINDASDVVNTSILVSTLSSAMINEEQLDEKTTDESYNVTSVEYHTKTPIQTTLTSVEARDISTSNDLPNDDKTIMDIELTTADFKLDPQTEGTGVTDTSEGNIKSSEETTELKLDSKVQPTSEKSTTVSSKSATEKRSLDSSTNSDRFEDGTTVYPMHSESSTSDFKVGASSVFGSADDVEESSTIKRMDSEMLGNERLVSVASTVSEELEREETTRSETELIESSIADKVKLVPASVIQNDHSSKSHQQGVSHSEEREKEFDSDNHANNLELASSEEMGVTFDPDGMTHTGPQDPDSIVFITPVNTREKGTVYSANNNEREEFETEKETNSNEDKSASNGTRKFEELVHIPLEREGIAATLTSLEDPKAPISFENGATLPEFQIHNSTTRYNDENEEMMQDAPHFSGVNVLPEFKPEESATILKKEYPTEKSTGTPKTIITEKFDGSSSPSVEVTSHLPDQSVIRPVKVKIQSEPDTHFSTSILPVPFSTQSSESSPSVSIPSIPTTGSKTVESSQFYSDSPITILPTDDKVVGKVEISTMVAQPELVDSVSSVQSNESTNSTIAVRTSVSVSSSSSSSNNGSQELPSDYNKDSSSNDSTSLLVSPSTSGFNDTSFPPTDSSLTQTPTPAPTSKSTGFKILKPKLNIGGHVTSRPRQPYVPPRPGGGATTRAPAPVSIFKKSKTRIASITSSTTARPYRPFSTVRVHYATHHGMAIAPPAGEWIISTEPVTTTTEPTTTTTEEPIEEVPFTDTTVMPVISEAEDEVMLVKVAGYIAMDRGLRWQEQLDNRQTPEYKKNAELVLLHLERLFRSSSIASHLWKIEIDGFSGSQNVRPVGVDFFLYMIKSNPIFPEHLESIFREKLSQNNTFAIFRVVPDKTAFEVLQEEPLVKATPPPNDEEEVEPPIPQWAIACIVIGAASLIFIVLFAAVTLYGRHHMRRRYSSKLSDEGERSSGEWESKMAAAYENMAADTLYDAEENSYKKSYILD